MKISRKWWKVLGLSLTTLLVAVLVVRTWVIPALIVRRIESLVQAKVTLRSWWLGGHSAGLVGLVIHEDPSEESGVWASIDRVTTDLSIWTILQGRLSPRRVEVHRPELTFKVAKCGPLCNIPRLKGGNKPIAPLPSISVDEARLTFVHEATIPNMVVSGIKLDLSPDSTRRKLMITGGTTDPTWGRWDVSGQFDSDSGGGKVTLRSDHFVANPSRLPQVPFVPSDVWLHVSPRGPLAVQVAVSGEASNDPMGSSLTAESDVTLEGTTTQFPSLGFTATGTTGHLRVQDGGLARVDSFEGEAFGGRVTATGTMDFRRGPYQLDLAMDLKRINVAETPKSWGLDQAGITGRLSGKVRLVAEVDDQGRIDVSGSTGEAVVEQATLQGIPVKSLKLEMRAGKEGVEYETKPAGQARAGRLLERLVAELASRLARDLIALQPPPAADRPAQNPADEKKKEEETPKGRLRLPKSLTTQIELEDVELAQIIARAQLLTGFPFPIPATGKLSLKAEATIPLGALADVKRYAFHGTGSLRNASIFKVDIGRLSARLDLADGVLELKDLRGVLVDRPHGGPDNPPRAESPEVPAEGPLPTGGFRGDLHAELSPPGKLSARFEGNQLPLSELAAPLFPRPTPLDGLATLRFAAQADLRSAADPAAWNAKGQVQSVHITYRGASLDEVSVQLQLKSGRLEVPALSARLAGRPLSARAAIDLKPPRAFEGTMDVDGWDLRQLVALVPSAPHPAPVAGRLTAHASGRGTANPWTLETTGRGQAAGFQAGPVPLGDVPFHWTTEGKTIALVIDDARPFAGRLAAQARVPTEPGHPIVGSARFVGIDTARLSAAIPGSELKLTGKAEGTVAFRIPAELGRIDANVQLDAPGLTVQGVPAEHVQAAVRAQEGVLKYEVTADSLGGKVKFQGNVPLVSSATAPRETEGELRVVGFTFDEVWKALHVPGTFTQLTGVGAIDANVRDVLAGRGKGLWAHGFVELRDLSVGPRNGLGRVRGILVKTPSFWRVERLSGELLAGDASGMVWGTADSSGRPQVGFNVRIDRASLRELMEFARPLQPYVDGYATLALAGSLDRVLRGELDLEVGQARVAGFPVSELKLPGELVVAPDTASGSLTIRRGHARIAGGRIDGDATLHIGTDRSFRGQVQLADVDLQTISRLSSDTSQPPTGRIGGRISFNGNDPARTESYQGRVDLSLTDASLFSIPVFREIDRFLGAARGGLFEQGELIGSIANRRLLIETLSLEGRLVQLHATGSVGLDGQLSLEVLVNTSQIIPETGQALVELIPGLRDVLGRRDQAVARVGSYLSNRLIKLRVAGTLRNPAVVTDPGIIVGEVAVSFFADVLKLPLALLR